jgi:hypothetical protein
MRVTELRPSSAEFYPKTSRAFAYAFLFVSALCIFHNIRSAQQIDFISFWAAAVLALDGNAAAAYDITAHKAVQDGLQAFATKMPFAYPPPFLLMVLPLGLLPYPIAAGVWIVGTYLLYFFAAKRLLPQSGWLIAAFPPVLLNGMIGQNGFLTAALFIAGMLSLTRKPFVAGLILGCLVIKPQLGLLIPLAFIAAGQWRAFAGAALSAVGLLLASWAAFGSETYAGMIEIAPVFASVASDGLVGWHKMASVYASLRLAGLPAEAAWALHVLVALAAAVTVWIVWRREADPRAKAAALAAASMLISPYIYVYDSMLLILPILWLIGAGTDRRLILALWLIPLISFLQSFGFNETVNLMPLLPIALLAIIFRELKKSIPNFQPHQGPVSLGIGSPAAL